MPNTKYPSPRASREFTEVWDGLIDEVVGRPHFKKGNLLQLKILCELYVESDKLTAFLDRNGTTYTSEGGRNGDQTKPRPELSQLNVVRTEIRNYSRLLGFVLAKEGTSNGESEKDLWE